MVCLVPLKCLSRPSRTMHLGDVSERNERRDSHLVLISPQFNMFTEFETNNVGNKEKGENSRTNTEH